MNILFSGDGALDYYVLEKLCVAHRLLGFVLVEPVSQAAAWRSIKITAKGVLARRQQWFSGELRETLRVYALHNRYRFPLHHLDRRKMQLRPLLEACRPDLFISASLPYILTEEEIAIPRYGCLNCHPSFLPHDRGPFPLQVALREKRTETGVTIHRMDCGIDTGQILWQKRVEIAGEDDYYRLSERCGREFGAAILPVLAEYERSHT